MNTGAFAHEPLWRARDRRRPADDRDAWYTKPWLELGSRTTWRKAVCPACPGPAPLEVRPVDPI